MGLFDIAVNKNVRPKTVSFTRISPWSQSIFFSWSADGNPRNRPTIYVFPCNLTELFVLSPPLPQCSVSMQLRHGSLVVAGSDTSTPTETLPTWGGRAARSNIRRRTTFFDASRFASIIHSPSCWCWYRRCSCKWWCCICRCNIYVFAAILYTEWCHCRHLQSHVPRVWSGSLHERRAPPDLRQVESLVQR